jgi:hypothetical protein
MNTGGTILKVGRAARALCLKRLFFTRKDDGRDHTSKNLR